MKEYHILKEAANGVLDMKGKFYPFIWAGADVAGKPGIRYYVADITLSSSQSGAVATSIDKVTLPIRGTTTVIAQNNIPATFAASNDCMTSWFHCGALGDLGGAIDVTIASVAGFAVIRYAEIDEMAGEYAQ